MKIAHAIFCTVHQVKSPWKASHKLTTPIFLFSLLSQLSVLDKHLCTNESKSFINFTCLHSQKMFSIKGGKCCSIFL